MYIEEEDIDKQRLMAISMRFWAIDSEFLMSGRVGHAEDIMSIQFSDGSVDNTVCLERRSELTRWLKSRWRVKTMYAFVLLPDVASVEEWLGAEYVSYRMRGVQTIGVIKYGKTKITVYDARPLLRSFGLRRLADCGKVVGFAKLSKPSWLGMRHWRTDEEHEQFVEYAKADAIITSRIVEWLFTNFGCNPKVHASAGTLAKDVFMLPKRLKRVKNWVQLSPLERMVKNCCFAGRSEGFTVGFTPNAVYSDVKSLYPISLIVTNALRIATVEPCDFKDLAVNSDLNETRYGWVEGVFESKNDFWGLPLRGRNNFYATGKISGFFHTFDLGASRAEVLHVTRCYKPSFYPWMYSHEEAAKMLIERLSGKMPKVKSMYAKAVLNSLSGKLGQAKPRFAVTSNFFAYSTLLAHSHLIMSNLFDRCPSRVLAMDTDSIFSKSDMSGKWFELTDGEYSIPVIMDVKGKGDLAFYRSKNYLFRQQDGSFVYGRNGWVYFVEDFFRLFDGSVTRLRTRKDVKHTLFTQVKEAKKMAKGRWRTKPVTLKLEKIKDLLSADIKRLRSSYDSYQLVIERNNLHSKPWNYDDIMVMPSGVLEYPKLLNYRLTSDAFQRKIREFAS